MFDAATKEDPLYNHSQGQGLEKPPLGKGQTIRASILGGKTINMSNQQSTREMPVLALGSRIVPCIFVG